MLKTIKQWIFWWKRSRQSKKFFKEAALYSKHADPIEPRIESIQSVICDWKINGIDITVPNFGGGRQEMEI